MNIEDLQDFPALRQLRDALWKTGKARGAAILVGAGFSRNANKVHPNVPHPPLWRDLANAMASKLYPGKSVQRDPLRLAEEFKALLGEAAVEALIREQIRDEEWLPGDLHKALVRLPWTDILTTNWDTLIERAALENLGQTYETVRCIGDIATTRAPRVVKLHGSLPSNRPFILTEDDYRTYPGVFAPFVNLVQQTLLENELCLLGFSGDDPNFLKWSGWVRDQLGASARRIHLVGALDLMPAERRLLESRNISAIDFTPLIGKDNPDKHREAAALFVDYLLSSRPQRPWKWPFVSSPTLRFTQADKGVEARIRDAKATLEDWSEQRASYPGWVICPPHIRVRLKADTVHSLFALSSMLNDLPPIERGRVVFESTWRLETALIPLINGLRERYEQIVRREDCWQDRDSRNFTAKFLLRTAREERDDKSFAEWAEYLDAQGSSDSDSATSVVYQRCLWAWEELNFREVRKLVQKLDGTDPLWKIRRAGLYCNLGDLKLAREAANEALRELRERFYRDRDSVWTVSRLAWTKFLSEALREWDSIRDSDSDSESEVLRLRILEMNADPWETMQAIDMKIEEDLRKVIEREKKKEPQFRAGTYRDHSSTVRLGSWWPTETIYALQRICDLAGLPARADHTTVMGSRLERAEVLTRYKYSDQADYLRVLRIAQSQEYDFINRVFGRIRVASMPLATCEYLVGVLRPALEFGLDQIARREHPMDDFWCGRAAAYTELLSRLCIRLNETECMGLFRTAIQYTQDLRWKSHQLFRPLSHLLEQSLSGISPTSRRGLITDLISIPLPEEAGISAPLSNSWPEPNEWLPRRLIARPNDTPRFAQRIETLLRITRDSEKETRSQAAGRLARLHFGGALTAQEETQFGEALWARRQSELDLPADTYFFPHTFFLLPSPNKEKTRELLLQRAYGQSNSDELQSLASASQRLPDGSRGFVLPREKALEMLRALAGWSPKQVPEFDLGRVADENAAGEEAIGAILADAILPSLSADDLKGNVLEQCFTLVESGRASTGAQALPELIAKDSSVMERAIWGILKAMTSTDNETAWSGFKAIFSWITLITEGKLPPLPENLIERVVFSVEVRREPALLHALNTSLKLVQEKMLKPEHQTRLGIALGAVFAATDYSDQSVEEIDPITYTIVRAAAVRLADGLAKASVQGEGLGWLTDFANDPMPEVRFALTDFDS
jgi:hypothetical protein